VRGPRGPIEKDKRAIFRKNCATLNVINAHGYMQICVQRGRAGYDQDGYKYNLTSSMPEYIIVFIIKIAITNCYKIKEEKKERETPRSKKGTRIDRDHMTDRKGRQNLAKCCSVSLRS